jgi:hypothetical protein
MAAMTPVVIVLVEETASTAAGGSRDGVAASAPASVAVADGESGFDGVADEQRIELPCVELPLALS